MFAKQISIQKNEANWDEILMLVHQGNEIIIMNGDETLARMTSAETISPIPIVERVLGAHPGAWMSDDFDAPLPDEFWLGKDA
jgi:hypothetical protein